MDPDRLLAALGHAIRETRDERRISQEALSLRTGVHRNYVGGVERGERNPTVASIARLAEGMGIPISELFARAEGIASGSPDPRRDRA